MISKASVCDSAKNVTPKRSFAEVVDDNSAYTGTPAKKKKQYSPKKINFEKQPVLVIVPNDENEKNEIAQTVEKMFDPLKDPINVVKLKKSGKTIVVCKSVSDLENVKNKIEKQMGDKITVNEPKCKEKVVKIVGRFNSDIDNNEIVKRIKIQNDFIPSNAQLEIIEVKKRNAYVCVLLKADEDSFINLIKAGKVKILWSICNVYENCSVLTCYKCSRHGHKQENCISTVTICGNCTGNHHVSMCDGTAPLKCIQCHERNIKLNQNMNTNMNTNHPSWSFKCPILNEKWRKLQRNSVYLK